MLKTVRIANKLIGDGHQCFIIAEAGSNHNGSFDQARKLIEVAANAGADAVKFQVFKASRMYPKTAGKSEYLKTDKSIYDIITKMQMPFEWLPKLNEMCDENNILFLSSVFETDSIQALDPYLPAFKIASYEMTHKPLIDQVAAMGKPVIISTGAADLKEVSHMVDGFVETGNDKLILMQCTAAYPAPLDSLNVRAIFSLKDEFGIPVGFSDHSRDPLVGPVSAVAVGANIIEKHFTLDNQLPGPDHKFAIEPDELKQMVQKIKETELALGTSEKIHSEVESELRSFARRSIFAIRNIQSGEKFTEKNIDVLRNGKLSPGLEPEAYPKVIGKKAACFIHAEQSIRREHVRD